MFHVVLTLTILAFLGYTVSRDDDHLIGVVINRLLLSSSIFMILGIIHMQLKRTSSYYIMLSCPIITLICLSEYIIPVLSLIMPSLFFYYNLIILVMGLIATSLLTFIDSKSAYRKIFHIECVLLFLFDYFYIQYFILSLSIVFYIMLIVELSRYGIICLKDVNYLEKLRSQAVVLTLKMKNVLYAHEQNTCITSHIELLIGCTIGYYIEYLYYYPNRYPMAHAGLVCIGVGDSMASIVGQSSYKWAVNHLNNTEIQYLRWPGSHKTICGSISFFISSYMFMTCLIAYEMGNGSMQQINWTSYSVSLLLSAIIEIYTIHDNLFSPLILYISYHLIN